MIPAQEQTDHDLIIEIKTMQNVMLQEIKEIKSGTAVQLADHEKRIKYLENYKGAIVLNSSLLWGAWGIVLTVLIYHVLKQ